MDGYKWTRLKEVVRCSSSLWQITGITFVFAHNHVVCDVTIILSVKEFHTDYHFLDLNS